MEQGGQPNRSRETGADKAGTSQQQGLPSPPGLWSSQQQVGGKPQQEKGHRHVAQIEIERQQRAEGRDKGQGLSPAQPSKRQKQQRKQGHHIQPHQVLVKQQPKASQGVQHRKSPYRRPPQPRQPAPEQQSRGESGQGQLQRHQNIHQQH